MKIEIKVPSPGESISEVQLANWLVANGDYVEKDQEIAEIDSDKATLSIAAEEAGKIEIKVEAGETIDVGTVIAIIDSSVAIPEKEGAQIPEVKSQGSVSETKPKPINPDATKEIKAVASPTGFAHVSPLAQKLMGEHQIDEAQLIQFFRNQRLSKKDVEFYLSSKEKNTDHKTLVNTITSRDVEKVKMSTLRLKLAKRLVSVKNETAMLTTFNEVNMGPVMEIRQQYKDAFKETHGVGLGFMSFFTKAVAEALILFPQINAQIDGEEIVHFKYADIGIAVSAPKGLVVPVLRNAEGMSLAEIELKIKELAAKARDNKITLDDMTGGTFTITNGGVFGSMLSTPIINPPQSAILGMHNIVDRPVAVNGKVEIQPIMYLALSYDHRIVDGKDSVSFLVKIKELIEDPAKMLFGGQDPIKSLLGI
ncbi:MAG: dihydrolipoyllysine-residue succinyltransferase [Bacteroidetes bacterium HGW-Bacteroidetes-17]|jgi:2-oxoglutarate dehydrogenase E2 component (dihydrolipoamide succinyltransferase)|nr:MAG: dihydrolipoyllysine-residue succinyltransferase [Bacteroidetes bacterium HGW-Bacteroidetes-17]